MGCPPSCADSHTHCSAAPLKPVLPLCNQRKSSRNRSGSNNGAERAQRFRNQRRSSGDEILSSTDASFSAQIPRQSCGQFPRTPPHHGVASSNPLLLHHTVLHFSDISENRSQSARERAICDDAWTRRASPAALIGRIRRNLSGSEISRSIGEAGGIGRFTPPKQPAAALTIFSQGCEESLPTSRRQSNECSRRQGYQALAREGDFT